MKKVMSVLSNTSAKLTILSLVLGCALVIASQNMQTADAAPAAAVERAEAPYTAVVMKVSAKTSQDHAEGEMLPMWVSVNNQAVKVNHIVIQESNQIAGMEIHEDTITITVPKMEKQKQAELLKMHMSQLLAARINIVEI